VFSLFQLITYLLSAILTLVVNPIVVLVSKVVIFRLVAFAWFWKWVIAAVVRVPIYSFIATLAATVMKAILLVSVCEFGVTVRTISVLVWK
jgi:hypothetical protein